MTKLARLGKKESHREKYKQMTASIVPYCSPKKGDVRETELLDNSIAASPPPSIGQDCQARCREIRPANSALRHILCGTRHNAVVGRRSVGT